MRKPQRSRGATGRKSRHRAENVATTMILSIVASLSGALRTEHYETNAIPSIVRAKWPLWKRARYLPKGLSFYPLRCPNRHPRVSGASEGLGEQANAQ